MNGPQFQPISPSVHQLALRWCGATINVWLIRADGGWILVDTGPPRGGPNLAAAVEFHLDAGPQAIILTHGHFDHAGRLNYLAELWDVSVWAHADEHPYIRGQKRYAAIRPADWRHRLLSSALPSGDFRGELRSLQAGEKVGAFEVLHVPGHAPGQLALWHPGERVCIAADAFRFKPGSDMPLVTYDRSLARESMEKILYLNPDILLTSHGAPKHR